ncbi:MAG: DNA polymerase III subunit beta [Deltaproteobacteria bacterium]|nr:DNA polymerase III subunit beta [Deltaproteobacteria bacterium]
MELRTTKTELSKTLAWTQSVVERRSTMPILSHCLLVASEDTLTVSATDLEVGITARQPAVVAKLGRVSVAARALFEIVKELPEDRLTLKALPNHWVEVQSGKARFKVVGMSADEFPALPMEESGNRYTMDPAELGEMIRKVSYAISTDETRFNLNGIFVEVIDGDPVRLRFVATDSHRLSYVDRPVKGKWEVAKGVIVPRKGVQELKRLIDGATGDYLWQSGAKYVVVSRDHVTLGIRLVDGQFPPYQEVVPTDHQRIVGATRQALIQGLRRAQLVTTDRSRGVLLTISSGSMQLTVSNPDVGEVEEEVAVTYTGEAFKWAANCRYLLDVLGVIEDEQVLLELKSEVHPCIIRSELDRGFLAVVMPMRI